MQSVKIVETDSGPFSVAALVTKAMGNAFAHRILVEETSCNVTELIDRYFTEPESTAEVAEHSVLWEDDHE
jgi:hypothetical protein